MYLPYIINLHSTYQILTWQHFTYKPITEFFDFYTLFKITTVAILSIVECCDYLTCHNWNDIWWD